MAFTGSRPAPTHVLAHLSDTHLIAAGGLLAGHIDTEAQLRKALARVESSGERVDALVLSGDLADSGDPAAYEQLLDFDDVDRLRAVVEGSDVRAVLSGHLHVTSFGTLGSVPVIVAGGVSYVDDVGAPRELLMGVDGPQSWNLIEVHADQVVATVVPIEQHETWPALSEAVTEFMATVPEADRREVFSRKRT